MARYCDCDICDTHRAAGSPWYTANTIFSDLSPLQQRIQLERHRWRGVCTDRGPPFMGCELTTDQWMKYHFLWDRAWQYKAAFGGLRRRSWSRATESWVNID